MSVQVKPDKKLKPTYTKFILEYIVKVFAIIEYFTIISPLIGGVTKPFFSPSRKKVCNPWICFNGSEPGDKF